MTSNEVEIGIAAASQIAIFIAAFQRMRIDISELKKSAKKSASHAKKARLAAAELKGTVEQMHRHQAGQGVNA